MPIVTFDLERGHVLREVLGAVEIERIVRVSELTAAPEGQLLEAVRDPGVPKLGDGYPGEPQWFVVNVEAHPDGPNAARLVVTYSNRQGPTWNQTPPQTPGDPGEDVKQFTGNTVRLKVARDRAGAPMTLSPPPAYAGWDAYQSEAEIEIPVGTLVFERVENEPPAPTWRTYGGRVNALAIGSYAANTLLFSRLSAQSDDGGRIWRCVYEFAYDPDAWRHRDRYHAPDGKVPDGAAEAAFDVQPEISFAGLDLDFSDSQTPI